MGLGKNFKPGLKRDWAKLDAQHKHRGLMIINLLVDIESVVVKQPPKKQVGRGHPQVYADACISAFMFLKIMLRLPGRTTEGLIDGLLIRAGASIGSPAHSTVSLRAKTLPKQALPKLRPEMINLAVDGTGLKLAGEGEWKTKIHGKTQRRKWRKLTLLVDTDTGMILDARDTGSDKSEIAQFDPLLKDKDLTGKTVRYDGAGDSRKCYRAVEQRGGQYVCPPKKNAHYNRKLGWKDTRNRAVSHMHTLGRPEWKRWAGYHERSKVETCMHRFKSITGSGVASKREANITLEINYRILVVNNILMNQTITL